MFGLGIIGDSGSVDIVVIATDQIGIKSINVEDTKVKQHLDNTGSVWKFNFPHSSHMGGVWGGDIPWTKGVHSNSRKWWPRSKTVLGQIGHFLDFNLTTKFAAQHTSPDECRNESLSSNDPETIYSSIISLSPYLDEQGILRVGGRLNRLRNKLGLASTNPIIVPKGHVMSSSPFDKTLQYVARL
jgi:hypothetical protein